MYFVWNYVLPQNLIYLLFSICHCFIVWEKKNKMKNILLVSLFFLFLFSISSICFCVFFLIRFCFSINTNICLYILYLLRFLIEIHRSISTTIHFNLIIYYFYLNCVEIFSFVPEQEHWKQIMLYFFLLSFNDFEFKQKFEETKINKSDVFYLLCFLLFSFFASMKIQNKLCPLQNLKWFVFLCILF